MVDVRPLREREFRLLFIGQGVTLVGSQLTRVAETWQVYQLTHSPLAVGAIGLIDLVPILAFALLGGALADWRDRRLLMLLTEAGLAVTSAVLCANALLPHPSLVLLYLVEATAAAFYALQRPALDSLMPMLVPTEQLTAAGAVSTFRSTVAMLAGPPLAGFLIAVFGLGTVYGIDVVTYAVSLGALWLMRAAPPLNAQRVGLQRVREGLAYAASRRDLLGTYLVDLVAMVFGMPEALIPVIAARFGGAGSLGLLFAAPFAGSVVASLASGWTNHVRREGVALLFAAGVWGAAIVLFGFASGMPFALVTFAIAGAADSYSGIFRSSIWNRSIPRELRGRLASIELLSYSVGPLLGDFEGGVVGALVSVRFSIVSGGVLCVLGVAACALLFPQLVAYRRPDARETAPL